VSVEIWNFLGNNKTKTLIEADHACVIRSCRRVN
jgi:hypothetical protein